MGGLLYAASPRLPWSQLLRRTFATDVEQCPRCHGRLRLIQNITEPAVAHAILERLGTPIVAPTAARDPTDDDVRDDCDERCAERIEASRPPGPRCALDELK